MSKIDRAIRGAAGILALAGLSVATPAAAASYVQEHTFSLLDVLNNPGPGPYTASVQYVINGNNFGYELFDPALGTLNAARWEIESAYFAEASAHLASTSTQPSPSIAGKLTLGMAVQTDVLRGTSARFKSFKSVSGQCSGTASCDISLTGANALGEVLNGIIVADDLAALTAVGFFFVTLDAVAELVNEILTGPGTIESSGAYQWAGNGVLGKLRLIYEYGTPTEVPAPSSLLLLGGALAWLGTRARRTFVWTNSAPCPSASPPADRARPAPPPAPRDGGCRAS